jgi:hypothetical protein
MSVSLEPRVFEHMSYEQLAASAIDLLDYTRVLVIRIHCSRRERIIIQRPSKRWPYTGSFVLIITGVERKSASRAAVYARSPVM